MKRRTSITNKTCPNFIGIWDIDNNELCDDIVNYFDANLCQQRKGITATGVVDNKIKDRADITIWPNMFADDSESIFHKYFVSLAACLKDYGEQWPFIKQSIRSFDVRSFNLGKYEKGQHFGRIHCERSFINMDRELAFMTYLSEDIVGGSTYFPHYDIEIKPEKGLTLIWPAMWTHAHKGNVVKSGSKYILTGWFNLVSKKNYS